MDVVKHLTQQHMTQREALQNISNLSALVVGDVMMDAYLFGKVERNSPEAPVPVVLMTGRDERAGGAANVARNVQALGADVHLATVIGDDPAGMRLLELFKARGMGVEACILSKGRPTTVKTRIIRDEAHMLRVDEETDEEISAELSASLLSSCISILDNKSIDVVIFEDYDKGVLTQELISGLIGEARKRDIPVAVDPKFKGFLNYRGVDLFKPNLKELREGLQREVDIPEGLPAAIDDLARKTYNRLFLITTLGRFGMWVHAPSEGVVHTHIPCRPSEIIDVSGAGDTVIATAALMLASGASPITYR